MPLSLQVKLLRAHEERKIRRSARMSRMTSTCADLGDAPQARGAHRSGEFREDSITA